MPKDVVEGECPEEQCNRNGCEGILERVTDQEGCTCFISPPCGYCCCGVICHVCGWEQEAP